MQAFAEWLRETAISLTIQTSGWMLPVIQSIHILAVGVVLASTLMVALRIVGWAGRGQGMDATARRYVPWIWGALVMLGLTGLLMIVAEPVRELMSPVFWTKMALLLVGVAATSAFQMQVGRALAADGPVIEQSAAIRVAAVGIVLLWCVIIFLGRWIAYGPSLAVY